MLETERVAGFTLLHPPTLVELFMEQPRFKTPFAVSLSNHEQALRQAQGERINALFRRNKVYGYHEEES